jgi:hypothetical protein
MKPITPFFTTTFLMVYLFGLAPAGAVEVYLNEVPITGAKDQLIENAKVYLDKNGNVHISAPEYKVHELSATGESRSSTANAFTSPATSYSGSPVKLSNSAHLKKRYFVVTEVTRLAITGYSIRVIVNNKYIKTLNDDIQQNILELNSYLNEGVNAVSFLAVRPNGKTAQSALVSDFFNLILGEGHGEEGGDLNIENVLCEFKVLATDVNEKNQSCTIHAK